MQPVLTCLDIDDSQGCLGFSWLEQYAGDVKKRTGLYLRDAQGIAVNFLIFDAEVAASKLGAA